jgi:hypothetical protein
VDNDNDKDVILAKGAWGKSPKGIEVYKNDGKGNFTKSQSLGSYDTYGLSFGDLDNDGFMDLVAVNGPKQPNQIFMNDRKGGFVNVKIDLGISGQKVMIGKINKDEKDDIIIVDDKNILVYLMN